jgi:hypothetical protein
MAINKTAPKGSLLKEFISIALQNTRARKILNELPPEFEEIFATRIKYKLTELAYVLRYFVDAKAIEEEKVYIPEVFCDQVEKDFKYLETETARFKEKYGRDMIKTVNKAKYVGTDANKNRLIDDAVFCLIKWDKAWLTVTTTRNIIIDRQYSGDSTFFKSLGKIVAQKTDSLKKHNANQHLFWLVERWGMVLDLQDTKIRNQLHKIMELQGYFDGLADVTPLSDLDYFNQQLKRHKII